MAVEFVRIDKEARKAYFEVGVALNKDGTSLVERKIPSEFQGTINDYLTALKAGLEIEVAQKLKSLEVKEIDESEIGPEFLGV